MKFLQKLSKDYVLSDAHFTYDTKAFVMDYIQTYRDKDSILALAHTLSTLAPKLQTPLRIMEVCGGHTHTLMKYGLSKLLPPNIEFIHGPGCPVCIMPRGRIDEAYHIAMCPDVILLTLGDMIKVPGSNGSLQNARAKGADVRFVYSPIEVIKVAQENPHKKVVFFAIGFETTTPMTAALLEQCIALGLNNVYFHINHVLVPPPLELILSQPDCRINALIAPSHVSVISGAKIYVPLLERFGLPIVVSGFEPLDMMQSILSITKQALESIPRLEIQYARVVNMEGNLKAQAMVDRYFCPRDHFEWRGLGDIPKSALCLRKEFAQYDAEIAFAQYLPKERKADHKACLCGEILKGNAKPMDCKVFGKACTPSNPIGSCMVSSEGACAAYYKYGSLL